MKEYYSIDCQSCGADLQDVGNYFEDTDTLHPIPCDICGKEQAPYTHWREDGNE